MVLSKPEAKRTALILGATGLIGGLCLRRLLDDETYATVIAVTRRKIPLAHSRFQQKIIDFHNLEEELQGVHVDDVYCCIGTTIKKAGSEEAFRQVDYSYPLVIAEILKKQGASHFLLVSAMGADSASRFFYNRVKGDLEAAVKGLEYAFVTIARPSLLVGDRQESRPLEQLGNGILGLLSPLLVGGFQRIKPIEADKVAAALVLQARAVAKGKRSESVTVLDSACMQNL